MEIGKEGKYINHKQSSNNFDMSSGHHGYVYPSSSSNNRSYRDYPNEHSSHGKLHL